MDFNKLLDTMRQRYRVEETSDDTYVISNGTRSAVLRRSDTHGPPDLDSLLHALGPPIRDFGHVGRDDLLPDTRGLDISDTRRRRPKGSLADPSIFQSPSKHASEDDDSNPLVNIDPITPSRNKKDSFEPDPDHYKPDRSPRFPPH